MAGEVYRKLTGPDVATVSITPITAITSAGVPTYGTATDYLTFWRDVNFQPRTTTRDLGVSSVRGADHHIITDDYEVSLSGYCKDQAGVTAAISAPILQLLYAYDFFKIIVVKGGVSFTFWVVRADGSDNYTKEEDVESFTFRRKNINGQANPLIASVA